MVIADARTHQGSGVSSSAAGAAGDGADLAAVVVAAGAGTRMGGGQSKSLRQVDGRPLVVHSVQRMADGGAGVVVVVAPRHLRADFRSVLRTAGLDATVVAGGSERQQSVVAGLEAVAALSDRNGNDRPPRFVLVHDAARPLVPVAVVERVLGALRDGAVAVIPVTAVIDTVRRLDPNGSTIVDRALLRAVQTPQGFRLAVLAEAHRVAAENGWTATDDAALCEKLGHPVVLVEGDRASFKITEPVDLVLAEALAQDRR